MTDHLDIEQEHAYLADPRQWTMDLYAAASEIRAEMSQIRGEVLGIARVCDTFARLHDLITSDPPAALAYLEGIIRGAADYTAGRTLRIGRLGTQIIHISGADQPTSRISDDG